jgi:outer membrane protein assembly factor BamB
MRIGTLCPMFGSSVYNAMTNSGDALTGKKMNRCQLTLLGILVLLGSSVRAENWAHWRGPVGNGTANANPPITWSDTENVKWKVAIPGRGSGSPVVWEQQVFVVTAVPSTKQAELLQFKLLCFDRQTGKLNWERIAVEAIPHQETHSTNGFASASPCTDGKHIYAHFGSRGLYCYTMQGELVWSRDFGDMQTRNGFGEGSSPTLADDLIVVPWDHEGPSYLFALNKLTGETVWQADRKDEPTCWATPLIVDSPNGKQVIMNGQTCARSYDLKTGKELWRCGGQTERPAASAVAANGLVYIGSGFRGSFLGAFRLDGRGDIEGSQAVVWTIDQDTPDVASPLLSQDRLYFHKGKSGQLSCVDAKTGQPHYMASRVSGLTNIYASPIAASGRVYLTDRSGTMVVIEDSPQLKILATNSMNETVDATPAVVDNQMFIRGEQHLFCIASP